MSVSRDRALRNIISQNIDEVWDAIRQQKTNELTMLNQEIQYSRKEAGDIKKNLMDLGISIPEIDKTSNFDKASNLPISSIGNNINMAEDMLEYQQGKVSVYEDALVNFRQGEKLMAETEDLYVAADSQLTPLSPDSTFEQDAMQWMNPEAYRDYLLEGGMIAGDQGLTFPGSVYDDIATGDIDETSLSEMEQLFQNLPEDQQKLLETNKQFREGFLAGKTTKTEAETSVLNRISTEQQMLSMRQSMKTATLEDMDRLNGLFKQTKNKIGGKLSPSVNFGGQSLQMATLALQAGDVENWTKIMTRIEEDKSLNPIMGEVSTLINGTLSADPDDPYGAYISVVSAAYQEYLDLESIGDKWAQDFGRDRAILMIEDATSKGKGAENIPPGYESEYGQVFYLRKRHRAFNKSGILTDNEADIQTLMMLDSMGRELTDTEISFLGMRSADDIQKFYAKGPLGGSLEDFEDDIIGIYDPASSEFDKDARDNQVATMEYYRLNPELFGDPEDVEELTEFEDLVQTTNYRSDQIDLSRNKMKQISSQLRDFSKAWDESVKWQSAPVGGASLRSYQSMLDNVPSATSGGMNTYGNKYGIPLGPNRKSFVTENRGGKLMASNLKSQSEYGGYRALNNDTDILFVDLMYLEEATSNQINALMSRKYRTITGTPKDYSSSEMQEQYVRAQELLGSFYMFSEYMVKQHKALIDVHNDLDVFPTGSGTKEELPYNFDQEMYDRMLIWLEEKQLELAYKNKTLVNLNK